MSVDLLDTIPADRREIARSALAAAFGAAPLGSLRPLAGGASGALIYQIDTGDRSYLLRLEQTAGDGFRDPRRGFACMTIAAEAGIAPAVHYADPLTGAAIMDFVPQRPILDYPGGREALLRALGQLAARLQQTPAFPAVARYPDIVGQLLGLVQESKRFAPGLLEPHADGFARIRQAYRWDSATLVSAHNDPNPNNILFDGERLWLIDWETAFRNDPLVDVAILTMYYPASTPELEDTLLRSWLGRAPDRLTRARLLLMRQMTWLFYGGVMLGMSAAPPPGLPEQDLVAPTLAEFFQGVTDGRFVIGKAETTLDLGKSFLGAFLAGLSAPGFEEALAIARQN